MRTYVEIDRDQVDAAVMTAAFKGMNAALARLQVQHVVRPEVRFFRQERPGETTRSDGNRPAGTRSGWGPGRHCFGGGDLRGFVKRGDTSERPVIWIRADQAPRDAEYAGAHEAHHHHQLRRGLHPTEDTANLFARSVTGYSPTWLKEPAESIVQTVTRSTKGDGRAELQRVMVALQGAYRSAPTRAPMTPAEKAAFIDGVTRRHDEYMAAVTERQRLIGAGYDVPTVAARSVNTVRGGVTVLTKVIDTEAIRAANRAATRRA